MGFAEAWPDLSIVQQLVAQLPWGTAEQDSHQAHSISYGLSVQAQRLCQLCKRHLQNSRAKYSKTAEHVFAGQMN